MNSKCDHDLGDIDVILSHDTPSNDGEQMCQMILISHHERQSYCPDKLVSPASLPAADIRKSNNLIFPSGNLVKKQEMCLSETQCTLLQCLEITRDKIVTKPGYHCEKNLIKGDNSNRTFEMNKQN